MEDIVTLIGSLGFPIACCIALGWYVKTEIAAMRSVVAENTAVIQKLLDHFKSGT